jgi:sporulation protein YlmC with PRC-barrel domain
MLHPLKTLINLPVRATDGDIGTVKDVYFDDHQWVVRYLVVGTSDWLAGRHVLISPMSVGPINFEEKCVRVGLTKQQINDSPLVDTDKPVSRQREAELLSYYGYSYYWAGPSLWGMESFPVSPGILPPMTGPMPAIQPPLEGRIGDGEAPKGDPNLRSVQEVCGYHVEATDDNVGHIENFLLDGDSWAIRYLVVDTRNWWPGKHVVIPPQWIKQVEWSQRTVTVDVTRETVKNSPEYDPATIFSRSEEINLYWEYRRPGYWKSRPL